MERGGVRKGEARGERRKGEGWGREGRKREGGRLNLVDRSQWAYLDCGWSLYSLLEQIFILTYACLVLYFKISTRHFFENHKGRNNL